MLREGEILAAIQEFYTEFNAGVPFEYRFVDDDYRARYAGEKRVAVLSGFFAGIAIIISCLGLFGLAAFTAERRLKEISIRKVLGSSEREILFLLSGDFTRIVVWAICLALPVGYIISRNWLNDFAFRIRVEWWLFLFAGLIVLIISWITVGIHTVKAARVNPVGNLRGE